MSYNTIASSKLFVCRALILWLLLPVIAVSQGTYYNGIDTGSATFVTDLHTLIYPHTKISYDNFDETNVTNFSSRDTTGGQKVVTCVYSGENYLYTPPFVWGLYSREHTWCHSWMPTYSSTAGPEYSDQHHLFPANQNNANGRRSNHPLGTVASIEYQYLEGKLGLNSSGQTVYEPRNSHKGDAARALLYMAVCYHGVNGNDWSFNYLNTVTLPGLSNPEAPQSVDVLMQWHTQDPPDAWEKARNEYVYSIQGNRNPFIDHPEYAGVIDFNTLTKKTTVTLAAEPSNYPTDFGQGTVTSTSIQLTWTASVAGTQAPSGYLLVASSTASVTAPTDGAVYQDDSTLSDNAAVVNLASSVGTYTFHNLPPSTTYYFKIYPCNDENGACNFKTDGLVPSVSSSTTSSSNIISITSAEFIYSQNFNSLAESGTSSTLPPGWTFVESGSNANTTYTAGTGSGNTGETYSFGTNSDRALGGLLSSSLGTIIGVQFTNASGAALTRIPVSYSGEQWRLGATGREDKLNFQYSTDATSVTTGTWTDVDELDFVAPVMTGTVGALDGNASANRTAVAHTITGVDIAHGSTIWFRWLDLNASGSDDGLAIDDFVLNNGGGPMPVELVSFAAMALPHGAELRWRTATETNNHGFEIQRSAIGNQQSRTDSRPLTAERLSWKIIGFVEGNGTSNVSHEYSFTDHSLSAGSYLFRLKQIDRDGSFSYSQNVEAAVIGAPLDEALVRAFPNPFNPASVISYSVPAAADGALTQLRVFDVMGREVALLVNGPVSAGTHSVAFNAASLSSGAYLCVLRTGRFSAATRLLLMK
jgi:endonuclease I